MLELRALHVQNILKVGQTGFVLGIDQHHRLLGRDHRAIQCIPAIYFAHIAGHGIFHILQGFQYRPFIAHIGLLRAGVFNIDPGPHPAAVKDIPAKKRPQRPGMIALIENGGGGRQADGTAQAEGGIQICGGHADFRILFGHLPFGPANLGALADYIRRHPHQGLGGGFRQRRGFDQFVIQHAGILAQKHPQPVNGLHQLGLQHGQQ